MNLGTLREEGRGYPAPRAALNFDLMRDGARRAVYAALGGALGAAGMTIMRLGARRRGIIHKTVSQAAEEWLAQRARPWMPDEPAVHHLLEQVLHVGYGATLGLVFGLIARRRPGSVLSAGTGFGVAIWLFGSWLLMPLLGAKRPPWRKGARENLVDLGAHVLHGVTTALTVDEMSAQPEHGHLPDALRRRLRVG